MSSYFKYFPKVDYLNQSVINITKRVKIRDDILNDPYAYLPYTISEEDRPEDIAYYYYGDVDKVWLVYLANNIVDPYTQWPLSSDNFYKTMAKKYSAKRTPFTFKPSATTVNLVTNTIIKTAHGYKTTDPVIYSRVGGTNIGGLTNGNTYYVRYINNNNFRLATTPQLAISGALVDLTTYGTGSSHTFTLDIEKFLESSTIKTNIKYYANVNDEEFRISPDTYELDTTLTPADWYPVTFFQHDAIENENKRTIWLINEQYAEQLENDLKKTLNERT